MVVLKQVHTCSRAVTRECPVGDGATTGVFFTDYTPDENPTVTDIGWFHRLLVFMKSTFKITELGASPTWVDRVRIPR